MRLIYTLSLLYSIQSQIQYPNYTKYLNQIKNLPQCASKLDCHHGDCINGKCKCDVQWNGDKCNKPFCVFGTVNDNKCSCNYGHTLHKGYCDKPCNHGNFSQITGKCECEKGWAHAGHN